MSRRKIIFHILMIAGIAAFAGCLENTDTEEKSTVPDTLVVVRRKNIDSMYPYNDTLTIRVLAPVGIDSGRITDSVFIPAFGRFIPQRDTVHKLHYPEGITLIFAPDSEGKEYKLIAGEAVQNEEKESFEFTKKIVTVIGGDSIFTDALTWNRLLDVFSTDLPVTVKSKKFILNGDGLELQPDLSGYTIKRPKAHYFIPNE